MFLIIVPNISSAQSFRQYDIDLFRSINNSQNSDRNGFFEVLDKTSIPSLIAVPTFLTLSGILGKDEERFHLGMLCFVSEAVAGGTALLLKKVIARPRPFDALDNVKVKYRESGTGYAFPSGHTSLAFALATYISLSSSDLYVTIPMLTWASLIGYGRVYLGLHYPSDILGGMVVGALSGYLIWEYREEIKSFVGKTPLKILIPRTKVHETGILNYEIIRIQIAFN